MDYTERSKIYKRALMHYGTEAQMVVAIEELSECTKELCKVMRGKGDRNHLAEEVADATIMLEQIRIAFGINDEVKNWMDKKLERLQINIPKRCDQCDYTSFYDLRCMCADSQWAGEPVKPDNYCRHWIPRVFEESEIKEE